jgi:hypothetical protein
MRYFHRTSLSPDAVMAEADRFFASHFSPVEAGPRRVVFSGGTGRVTVSVGMEGGHYTRVTVDTDQVGESELDKLAKRFLAVVHTKAEPQHELRGAY